MNLENLRKTTERKKALSKALQIKLYTQSISRERKQKMNSFEQKLVEILNRSDNGEIIPVEHCISNSPSKTAGKVTQTVSFSYDVPEPGEKDGPQLKK